MTPAELVELAKRMRAAQRKYFKSRETNDLFEAKALELAFDREAERGDTDGDCGRA